MDKRIFQWQMTEPGKVFTLAEKSTPSLNFGEVLVKIAGCGVCHTDIHQTRNDWGRSSYPMVPGHEIIGRVKTNGSNFEITKPLILVNQIDPTGKFTVMFLPFIPYTASGIKFKYVRNVFKMS